MPKRCLSGKGHEMVASLLSSRLQKSGGGAVPSRWLRIEGATLAVELPRLLVHKHGKQGGVFRIGWRLFSQCLANILTEPRDLLDVAQNATVHVFRSYAKLRLHKTESRTRRGKSSCTPWEDWFRRLHILYAIVILKIFSITKCS